MAEHQVNYASGLPVVLTSVDKLVQWGRSNSLWALSYGLACCAIEMMAAGGSRYDFDRFGTIFRASPRHSEVMIIAGTLCKKHAEFTRRLYDQMPDPKWVISRPISIKRWITNYKIKFFIILKISKIFMQYSSLYIILF